MPKKRINEMLKIEFVVYHLKCVVRHCIRLEAFFVAYS